MDGSHENVLALLSGCSAQAPMPFDMLVQKSGQMPEAWLRAILDSLFDARAIQRCEITRNGQAQLVLWPTGVISKMVYGKASARDVPQPARDQHKPNTKQKDNPAMKLEKTKVQKMIDLLIKNGSATGKELCAAAVAGAVNPFLGPYLDRGLIVREDGGSARNHVYKIAPGTKPEDLAGRKKATSQPGETAPATAVAATPAAHKSFPAPTKEATTNTTRFRAAFTSDKTLLLLGLGNAPIELSQEQTELLVSFVVQEKCA